MKRIKLERNKIILTIIDIIIVILSCILSKFLLSNTFYFATSDWQAITNSIILSVIMYQIFFRVFDVYRNITRY